MLEKGALIHCGRMYIILATTGNKKLKIELP
jgi:hypothetical protein